MDSWPVAALTGSAPAACELLAPAREADWTATASATLMRRGLVMLVGTASRVTTSVAPSSTEAMAGTTAGP